MKITLCIDKQDRNNPSSELRKYSIDIGCSLRSIDSSFDELKISTDDDNNLIGKIIRRCYVDKYGVLKKLEAEEIQELEIPKIMLFEGVNYVYIKEFTNLNMKIEYLTNAEMNKYFASKVEMNTTIKQTYDEIMLSVSEKAGKENIISYINLSKEKIKIDGKRLELANFIITDNKLYSEIRLKYDYTSEDIQKIQDYYLEKITLTDEEFEKYDINKDGVVDLFDAAMINIQMKSNISKTNPGRFEIDTQPDNLNVINMYDGARNLKYYLGYWQTALSKVTAESITTDSLNTKSLHANNLDCGSSECNSNDYTTVSFNNSFSIVPSVVATPITSSGDIISLKIIDVTKQNFKIKVSGISTVSFNWIAISK